MDRALEIQPDFDIALLNRGALLCDYLYCYEEALDNFNKALEINPNDHLAWYNRGNALRSLNYFEDAIISYERALELQPDYSDAQDQRDWVLYLLEHQDKTTISHDFALELVSRAIGIFLDSGADEDEIVKIIQKFGVRLAYAFELVTFIPLAFGRVFLESKGAVLQPNFVWIDPVTEQENRVSLWDQPIFQAAYNLAEGWMKEKGDTDDAFLFLAQWSSEVNAANKALNQGSQLENCEFSETIGYDYRYLPHGS